MAVSVRQFKAEFPEFNDTPVPVIQRCLSDATGQINSSIWGTKTNQGIKYLAADLLSSGPLGEQARLKADNRSNNYHMIYERLKRQVTFGFRHI